MPDLGEIGKPHEDAEEITFGYFGKRLRVHPGLTDVAVIRLVKRMGGLTGFTNLEQAVDTIDNLVETLIHPQDVEEFWGTAQENRQQVEDIGDALVQILEGVTDRPTRRPSVSSDGPLTTSPNSGGDSSLVVIDRYVKAGRPDLALGVVRAVEARSA